MRRLVADNRPRSLSSRVLERYQQIGLSQRHERPALQSAHEERGPDSPDSNRRDRAERQDGPGNPRSPWVERGRDDEPDRLEPTHYQDPETHDKERCRISFVDAKEQHEERQEKLAE